MAEFVAAIDQCPEDLEVRVNCDGHEVSCAQSDERDGVRIDGVCLATVADHEHPYLR
ncbi:MAG: hypothetical protein M3Z46_05720 [Actinomycetota bacterium]|nr:hypothetical protein [Actinomycetota bacterium]